MKRWRWPIVILIPVLLAGCSYLAGINAYADRPDCAPAGVTPERAASKTELDKKHRVNGNCYYKFLITEKNDQDGWAKGHVPKSEIEWNKEYVDNPFLRLRIAIRRMLDPNNVPLNIYKFQVNGVNKVTVNSVAYFVKEPNSEALTFLTTKEMCDRRDKLIQKTLDTFYTDISYPVKVPPEFKKECPNLKDEYNPNK